ncbi:MOSC domain-containing protein [Lewinellaceae bacterium SD302]|nr:MOSC domain-containing protein [Lewinellaceae bacterium SD302]
MIIHSLHYYPVKALAGHSPDSWKLEARGFQHDRRWMFVNPAGNFMSQRKYPEFVHWRASVVANDLVIESLRNDGESYRIENATGAEREQVEVTLWNDTFQAGWINDPTVDELVAQMGIGAARLVFLAEDNLRPLDPDFAKQGENVSLADGFPYLITNTASLEDANQRMDEKMAMSRFRPNIVVKSDEPWAEDNWTGLKIGKANFRTPKPCARCRVITIDQESGEQRIELLGELSRFRKVGRKILFGMNGVWDGGAQIINTGDPVHPV